VIGVTADTNIYVSALEFGGQPLEILIAARRSDLAPKPLSCAVPKASSKRKRDRRSQPASISAATARITVSISAIQSLTSSRSGGPGSASSPG
jgi:hypothetical protein